jgi:RNA ligase (TIGR02306 family)
MIINGERKLATVRTIRSIIPIPGADFIVLAEVDGWQAVVSKADFKVGDLCLYLEIDSLLPASDVRYKFLADKGTKNYDGKEWVRIRTIKLRKQLSQGLAMPLSSFPEIDPCNLLEFYDDILGIEKYEPDVHNKNVGPKCIPAFAAGSFPYWLEKTDEPRIQDLYYRYNERVKDVEFAASMKLDGSSCTIAYTSNNTFFNEKLLQDETYPFNYEDAQLVLASRNLTLKYNIDAGFWRSVEVDNIPDKIRSYCVTNNIDICVQGECMGDGIQENRECINGYKFFAFRVFFPEEQRYASHDEFIKICADLEITTAPQLGVFKVFEKYTTIKELLAASEIGSIYHKIAEGIVYVSTTLVNGSRLHFKAINNNFLLGEK